jgi:hypothetical protein
MKLFDSNSYGVMAANNVSFGSGLGLLCISINPQTFFAHLTPSQLKMCHGLALMGHQNLFGNNNTSHWSDRCDMKLFMTATDMV